MNQFFRCVSDGHGKVYYFDAGLRKKILTGELPYEGTDNYSAIVTHFLIRGEVNCYEYNPLTKQFLAREQNTTDDSREAEILCRNLDWQGIVPDLVIKPVVHPFRDRNGAFSQEAAILLKCWISAVSNVPCGVQAFLWADIENDAVMSTVEYSVWNEVRDIIETYPESKRSLWDTIWAYVSSFFVLSENPFQSAVDLWEMGLVPSFDGQTWRLLKDS